MSQPDRLPTGRFGPGNKFGKTFAPGQSGNPYGLRALQREWREAYAAALISVGSAGGGLQAAAENAAKIVWKAAVGGEAWAALHLVEVLGGGRPAGFTMMAGVSMEATGENADAIFEAFYCRIAECSARIEAGGDSEDAAAGAAGADGVPVEVLGKAKPA